MSNIPHSGENDQSLRDDLDRLGEAYGQLQREEPPELLDQAILNSAHRAVEKKPRWMQFGWLHGLTTAAVFVLAISLVFHQREQVPVYEDGVRLDSSNRLNREKAAEKRSLDSITGDLRMELKKEDTKPGDVFGETPVSTPDPDDGIKPVARDQASEPTSDSRGNAFPAESLQAKVDNGDKDTTANELAVEKQLVDDANSEADTPEVAEMRSRQFQPAAIVAAPAAETGELEEAVDEIEQKLSAIMKMKASGDEAWRTELALFKQQYPDYPLPDELTK